MTAGQGARLPYGILDRRPSHPRWGWVGGVPTGVVRCPHRALCGSTVPASERPGTDPRADPPRRAGCPPGNIPVEATLRQPRVPASARRRAPATAGFRRDPGDESGTTSFSQPQRQTWAGLLPGTAPGVNHPATRGTPGLSVRGPQAFPKPSCRCGRGDRCARMSSIASARVSIFFSSYPAIYRYRIGPLPKRSCLAKHSSPRKWAAALFWHPPKTSAFTFPNASFQ